MSTMSNVQLWQYVVIAGPAAVLGGARVYMLCRERVRSLEALVLSECDSCEQEAMKRTAMYMLGMDCASADGDATWFRRPS